MKRVCLVPRLSGVGGMVSFQHKLAAGLHKRGIDTSFDLADEPYDAVLVIGGTRHLAGLWRARQRGVRIVQRLDGMNWVHRVHRTGLKHALRAEYGNLLLTFIRNRLAGHIVYQSQFSKRWWEREKGATPVNHSVVYNGVDLAVYAPYDQEHPPADHYRLLLVEGSLLGGYEMGLETAIAIANRLETAHSRDLKKPLTLMVAGRVSPQLQAKWNDRSRVPINWAGILPREHIPALDRSAHLLYAGDINAACPNSVIEALACGLPVLAYHTGALPELVPLDAGSIVPYGGDPWRLDQPDIAAAARAAVDLLKEQAAYRRAARRWAEETFGLDKMVIGYLRALAG